MHAAAFEFVREATLEHDIVGVTVLDFGSYHVNGSVRAIFFDPEEYTGIDLRPGRDVDVVADARSYKHPEPVDVVVCCEMLEHTPQPEKVILNAYRNLKPGGLFILTAAGVERSPHNNDGEGAPGKEHYENIDAGDLYEWLTKAKFKRFDVTTNPKLGDVYAVAIR